MGILGVAQPGSAPALGAGGRRFKSYHLDHLPIFTVGNVTMGPLMLEERTKDIIRWILTPSAIHEVFLSDIRSKEHLTDKRIFKIKEDSENENL